jgi:flagellar biogenesis protein FliO
MFRAIASLFVCLCLASASAADVVDSRPLPVRTSAGTAKHASSDAARKNTSASPWWTTMGSLVAVIAVIVLAAKFVRKHAPAAAAVLPPEAFRVLGRKSLDMRHAVHLVRLGSRLLVLGVSPEGMRTLAEISDPVEVDYLAGLCARSEPSPFAAGFGRVLQRFGADSEPPAERESAAAGDPAALRLKSRLQQGELASDAAPDEPTSLREAG